MLSYILHRPLTFYPLFHVKLNRWGFVKHRAASIDIFSHGKFIRGDVALCCTMTCSGPDPDGNEDLMVLRHALHSNKRQQLSLPYKNGDNMSFMEGSLDSIPHDHRHSIGLNMGSSLDSITPLAAPLVVINQRVPNYSSQVSREGPLFVNNIRPPMLLNGGIIVDSSSRHHSPLMSSNALQSSNRQTLLGNESDLLSYEEALFLENIKNQRMQLSIQQQQQTQQQAYQMTSPTLAEMTRSSMNADLSRFDSLLQQERECDIQRQTNLMVNPLHPKQHQSCFADSGRSHQRRRFHY